MSASKKKVNIDSSEEIGKRSKKLARVSSLSNTKIIRHRPTISIMTEADYFVPKMKTNSRKIGTKKVAINRHNCNDINGQ